MRSRPHRKTRLAAILSLGLVLGCYQAWLEPADAGVEYALQGEYVTPPPDAQPGAHFGAQVIALGDAAFRIVHLEGGLPGTGWDGQIGRESAGRRDGDVVLFEDGSRIENGLLHVAEAVLQKVSRQSLTLGSEAPEGAVIVFDGTMERVDGAVDERGLLVAGARSRDRFQDARFHVEFRTPFMPGARGQERGNSGVTIQNRYEVRILDSFGLPAASNECGGIDEVAVPDTNMTFPPLAWQTLDVDFQAARFDAEGRKVAPARMSVWHNGMPIHRDVELPDRTAGGDWEGPEPGPLTLQDHGDPVFFRNIWVLPKTRADAG